MTLSHVTLTGDRSSEGTARSQPVYTPMRWPELAIWTACHLPGIAPTEYNVGVCLQLTGHVEPDRLRRAFSQLIRRHPALRTGFCERNGRPVKFVADTVEADRCLVVRKAPADPRTRERFERRFLSQSFDLDRPPLLRALLHMVDDNSAHLAIVCHHLVWDGWSANILFRVISDVYQGKPTEDSSAIEALASIPPNPGVDVASYWNERLRGAVPLSLARPATHRVGTAKVPKQLRLSLPPELVHDIRSLARELRVTPFACWLSAFTLVAARYGGTRDVSIGTPIISRRPDDEAAIGCFVTRGVIRTSVDDGASFADYVLTVRDAIVEALAHVPFPSTELHVSAAALSQVTFSHAHDSISALAIPGVTASALELPPGPPKVPFEVLLQERADDAQLIATFDCAVHDEADVRRIIESFRETAHAVARSPQQRVGGVPFLTQAHERAVVLDNNRTEKALPFVSFASLVMDHVQRSPDFIAAVDDECRLTFRRLIERSATVADALRSNGVSPDCLVAVQIERSVDMVVAVMGVMLAGGAFVPIDPALPDLRQQRIAADSGARVMVTRRKFRSVWQERGLRTLAIEDLKLNERTASVDVATLRQWLTEVKPKHLAYVMYTSGSTGAPKGVAIAQDGLANYVRWAGRAYRVTRGAGSAVLSSLGFDLTVTSLFIPLAFGRSVHLLPEADTMDALVELLNKEPGLSYLKITPAHLELLDQMIGGLPSVAAARALVVGGEALPAELVRRWRDQSGCSLINEYGPTETVVGCSSFRLPRRGPVRSITPIGRPIWNSQFYILDDAWRPAPLNVPGELFIGGVGVARGYFGRPGLTAERFVPDPFGAWPGARLYATGDWAVRRPRGDVDFLGRRDAQVKLRGYRIELGEIEVALSEHPDVANAVVVAVGTSATEKQLIAYVTSQPGATAPDASVLKQYLARHLPTYMIPARIIGTGTLPMTDNGKIDRKRIAAWASSAFEEQPLELTPAESQVAGIWESVLEQPVRRAADDFFELGGHSLSAVRVVTKLQEALGVPLQVGDVFEYPSLRALTCRISELAGTGDRRVVASHQAPTDDPYAARNYEAPIGETEVALAEIWAEVLGVERVGRDDDFIELGGHSLRAMKAVSRIRSRCGVKLSMRAIFEQSTVRALSEHLCTSKPLSPRGADIRSIDRPSLIPASFGQEAAWFLEQVAPENHAYQAQTTIGFEGPLDVGILERALSEIVKRHEAFRTTFHLHGRALVQRIREPWAVHLTPIDLARCESDAKEIELQRLVENECLTPFARVDQLPLIRWTLIRLSECQHVLVQVEHHFLHDGWSFALFVRELCAIYEDIRHTDGSQLPTPAAQFADFALWQRQWIESPEAEAQIAFWKRRLAGVPPLLALPTDRPRPERMTFRGDKHRVTLPGKLTAMTEEFSRRSGVTIFMTMLAAFQALLWRYTAQDDFCVGTGVANRHSRAAEDIVGMMVNTVALRSDVAGDPTGEELVRRVRRSALEAFAYEAAPFAAVVAALKPDRRLNYLPVYQVMFSFHDSRMLNSDMGDVRLTVTEALSNRTAKNDLSVVAIPSIASDGSRGRYSGMTFVWEYSTDLFDAATIGRMAEHYEILLTGMVSNPSERVSKLPLLADGDRERLLVEWKRTPASDVS